LCLTTKVSQLLKGRIRHEMDFDWIFFMRYARVILNRVKELSSNEGKIVPSAAKVPHLQKGRIRNDIGFRLDFFYVLCTCHPEQSEGT